MESGLYGEKQSDYYQGVRTDLLPLIGKKKGRKVLEIGAGSGENLVYLKEIGLASFVAGIEKFELKEGQQTNPKIDIMHIADVETDPFPFENESFDLVICPDVIEHLLDPWKVMDKLGGMLKKNGEIILSIPNIRFFKVLFSILFKGRFEYQTTGIMDRTHLRFFCRKDLVQMLEQAGFTVLEMSSDFEQRKEHSKKYYFNLLTFGLFKEFFIVQNFIRAKKN